VSIRPAGDQGLLVELAPGVSVEELHATAKVAGELPGVRACIVGHSSLYLLFDQPEAWNDRVHRVESALQKVAREPGLEGRSHRLAVSVHSECAPDLSRLLSTAGMDRPQFLARLGSLKLRARYLGFRPGFAYLEGIPPEWNLPRLAQPRIRVPAGSLGITGTLAGFYPSDSPGGWNLIGRSAALFWDPRREPPNLIAPGDEVLLEPTEEVLTPPRFSLPDGLPEGEVIAEVLRPGQLALIVGPADLRRYVMGLPVGGPFDLPAAAAANLAVGNPAEATVLECALVGPQLMFGDGCRLSWYGAHAEIFLNETEVRDPRDFEVRTGDVVTIGRLQRGLRGYLAVGGEWSNPASKHIVTPLVLRGGWKLLRRRPSDSGGERTQLHRDDARVIGAWQGPHPCGPDQLRALQDQLWEVTPALDRTGIRLRPTGRVIEQPSDLPSCGTQFGTVQWHPSGELVALGPDHPITGGYRQPLTVVASERWKLAQLAPGDRVRWMIR
jgi:KipI family sensor histidine kinase inhibitor